MTDTPALPRVRTVGEVYGSAFADEEAFQAALNESLGPRGFDLMFELVADLGLLPGSAVLDVGAREGYHCIELSRLFGFTVRGIEPVRRHLDHAARALEVLAAAEPVVAARIRVDEGVAQRLPAPGGSIDLIWCRDVLEHVEDLDTVFAEFRRVLRPGGTALVYQMTATDWLTSAEADRLWPPVGIYAASVDPQHFESAIAASGLHISQSIQLHGEWRERAEEDGAGLSSRQLLWVSRLLRNRRVYEDRFGAEACDAMLANSMWGVYQMIGKLNPRIYMLTR